MNYRDQRFSKTTILLTLTIVSINAGMALGKLDNGIATSLTIFAAVLGAVAIAICLFILIRDVWKRDAS
jgi:hypothetical protein